MIFCILAKCRGEVKGKRKFPSPVFRLDIRLLAAVLIARSRKSKRERVVPLPPCKMCLFPCSAVRLGAVFPGCRFRLQCSVRMSWPSPLGPFGFLFSAFVFRVPCSSRGRVPVSRSFDF